MLKINGYLLKTGNTKVLMYAAKHNSIPCKNDKDKVLTGSGFITIVI